MCKTLDNSYWCNYVSFKCISYRQFLGGSWYVTSQITQRCNVFIVVFSKTKSVVAITPVIFNQIINNMLYAAAELNFFYFHQDKY